MEVILSTIFAITLILIQKTQKVVTNRILLSKIKKWNTYVNAQIRNFIKLKNYTHNNKIFNSFLIFLCFMSFFYYYKSNNVYFLILLLFFSIILFGKNYIKSTVNKIKGKMYIIWSIFGNPKGYIINNLYLIVQVITFFSIIFAICNSKELKKAIIPLSHYISILIFFSIPFLFLILLILSLIADFFSLILFYVIKFFFTCVFFINKKEPLKPLILIIELSNYIILAFILYKKV